MARCIAPPHRVRFLASNLTLEQEPSAGQDNENKWRVQAVPATASSFESRKPLPAAWRGLRDQTLSDATGVPGCVFVHAAGFIGGHATRNGAVELARLALKL
jgi:uncharacterized UPF0160 family protein